MSLWIIPLSFLIGIGIWVSIAYLIALSEKIGEYFKDRKKLKGGKVK